MYVIISSNKHYNQKDDFCNSDRVENEGYLLVFLTKAIIHESTQLRLLIWMAKTEDHF